MTTWNDLIGYVHSNYKIADERPELRLAPCAVDQRQRFEVEPAHQLAVQGGLELGVLAADRRTRRGGGPLGNEDGRRDWIHEVTRATRRARD